MAAAAKAALVVECGLPSGAFSCAEATARAGGAVMAVPGDIGRPCCEGSHMLLRRGAAAVVSEASLLEELARIFGI